MKISNKRLLVSVAFLLLLAVQIFSQGILEHPRKVYKLATQYFDILFSDESSQTAYLLAQKADDIYIETKSEIPLDYDFRMPVIISPDSQIFSVEYTSSPYNRIIIFEGSGLDSADHFLLYDCFKREVAIAQLQSIRSKGSKVVAKVMKSFTPVSFIHLPDSFIQGAGRIYVSSSITDKQALQLLTQAKVENKFPTWFQSISIKDSYPGNEVYLAANSAFNAFLVQQYGIEKYDQFWELCGKINLLFIGGVFNKAYGTSITNLWKEFEDSIPVPENTEEIEAYEKYASAVFPNDRSSSYDFLISSNYGLIWYDKIKKEVDLYDKNSEHKIRELLFLAQDVTNLSLSDDQRYLCVSYNQIGHRKNFIGFKTQIFDLRERVFLKKIYDITDSSIIKLADGTFAVAGFAEEDNYVILRVLKIQKEKGEDEVIYEKAFPLDCLPYDPVTLEDGILYYLVNDKAIANFENPESQVLCRLNLQSGEEVRYSLPYKIFNLRKDSKFKKNQTVLTFNYFASEDSSYSRIGYIEPGEKLEVDGETEETAGAENLYLQNVDFAGGINSFSFDEEDFYYCSKKFSYDVLKTIKTFYLPFAKTQLVACNDLNETEDSAAAEVAEDSIVPEDTFLEDEIKKPEYLFVHVEKDPQTKKKTLGEYNLGNYYPFAYYFPPSILPLVAIKEISLDSGISLAPALGFTLRTGSDPFDNTRVTFSTSAGLAKLSYQKIFTKKFTEYTDFSSKTIRDLVDVNTSQKKNISAAAYIENFSTPVDIRLASSFRFNLDGQYDFAGLLGTSWTIPFRMNFRNLTLGINGYYSASTDYYDPTLVSYNPPKKNWPSFAQAYQIALVWTGVEYSNIHQYGLSKYEQRGISVGAKLSSFWDIYEIEILKAYKKELEKQLEEEKAEKQKKEASSANSSGSEGSANTGSGGSASVGKENQLNQEDNDYNLTKAQIDEIYNEKMLAISQFNLGFYFDVKIPRLTPLQMVNGWVLSVPSSIHAEFLKENGNALNICLESLLIGKEIQNGLPFTQIFFSRAGLKLGYDFNLNYDTATVQLPDIRRKRYLVELFSNTYVSDSIYVLYDMDFSSPIGVASKILFNGTAKFEFFPRTSAFKLDLVLNAHF